MSKKLVSDLLVDYLERRGVTKLFGLCGHTVIGMLDALSRSKKIEYIGTRHEAVASTAADGYARITHKASVVMCHLGPGLTNVITGVANASLDSIPMVVIAGDVPSYYFGRHPHQEIQMHEDGDQYSMLKPVCKRSWRVDDVEALPYILDKAFRLAEAGRPGPVLVDVPMDMFSREMEEELWARTYKDSHVTMKPALDPAAAKAIAKKLVEIAKAEGADAIAHGCTGKGNDQVRFELAIKRFAPDMPIIAPWREWDIKGRDEEIDYAEAHNVPLKISRETNYSKDKNLWHLSHEGLDLEDPANEPQYEKPGFLEMSVSPIAAPDKPTYVTIDFEKGVPVAVDGEKMKASDVIRKLNKLGGENGIGLLDIVENRLVGMKDRGVYETPGGTILYKAHQCLEMITIDKDTAHMKSKLAVDFADLVYNGKWFTPLREALSAFADKTQEHVTGSVKLKLYKGNMITASITSPESLYSEELVTFNESSYDQTNATGFINLWGLPDTVLALREQDKL